MNTTIPDQLLPQPAAQALFGVSHMTIHRWRHDPTLNFPTPIKICGRNYFRAADLAKWQQSRMGGVSA